MGRTPCKCQPAPAQYERWAYSLRVQWVGSVFETFLEISFYHASAHLFASSTSFKCFKDPHRKGCILSKTCIPNPAPVILVSWSLDCEVLGLSQALPFAMGPAAKRVEPRPGLTLQQRDSMGGAIADFKGHVGCRIYLLFFGSGVDSEALTARISALAVSDQQDGLSPSCLETPSGTDPTPKE